MNVELGQLHTDTNGITGSGPSTSSSSLPHTLLWVPSFREKVLHCRQLYCWKYFPPLSVVLAKDVEQMGTPFELCMKMGSCVAFWMTR